MITNQVIYNPAIVAIKSSILLLYKRLFPFRWFIRLLWAIGSFVVAYCAMQALAIIFSCSPVQKAWEPSLSGHCIDLGVVLLVAAVINVVTDVVILALPLPHLWRLQISRARRIQLSGIYLLGGL